MVLIAKIEWLLFTLMVKFYNGTTLIKSRLTTDPIGWEEYVNAITQIWGCL